MSSLASAVRVAEALNESPVIVTPERCARYRHRAASCEYCVAVCPADALSFDALNAPEVDEASCTSCGACASACPTGAIEHVRPTDAQIEAEMAMAIEAQGSVTFVCSRTEHTPGTIRVPCLGRVDASMILHALSSGAEGVHLVSGQCESCPSRDSGLIGQAMAETAASLASALGRDHAVTLSSSDVSEAEVAQGSALSRRAFFLMLASRGTDVGARAAGALLSSKREEASADSHTLRGEFTKHIPTSRSRLTGALLALSAEREDTPLAGFLFSMPAIDAERCRGCGMCVKCCPTGALESTHDGERFVLTFNAAACTSCYLCEDICSRDAIARSEGTVHSVLVEPPLTVVCKECEDPFSVRHEEKIARLFSTFVSHA